MAKNSQAKINANTRYNKKAYDNISIRVQKGLDLPATIEAAAQKAGISKASYMQAAIVEKLRNDGFSVGEVGTDTGAGNVGGESGIMGMLKRQRDEERAVMDAMRREEEEREAFWDSLE